MSVLIRVLLLISLLAAAACSGGGDSDAVSGPSKPHGTGADVELTAGAPGAVVWYSGQYADTGGIYNASLGGETPWTGTVHGCGDGTLLVSFTGGEGCATLTPAHDPAGALSGCGASVVLETWLPGDCLP